jgi:hypothetical protein
LERLKQYPVVVITLPLFHSSSDFPLALHQMIHLYRYSQFFSKPRQIWIARVRRISQVRQPHDHHPHGIARDAPRNRHCKTIARFRSKIRMEGGHPPDTMDPSRNRCGMRLCHRFFNRDATATKTRIPPNSDVNKS